jgi:hypothetical protein
MPSSWMSIRDALTASARHIGQRRNLGASRLNTDTTLPDHGAARSSHPHELRRI